MGWERREGPSQEAAFKREKESALGAREAGKRAPAEGVAEATHRHVHGKDRRLT